MQCEGKDVVSSISLKQTTVENTLRLQLRWKQTKG